MWTLSCEIKIADKIFRSVNDVRVNRSVHEMMARATIKVPVTAALRQRGTPPAKVPTAQAVKVGDRVVIRLGYNGKLNTEFVGYVKGINLRTPIEIECEDEFYQCRRRQVTTSGTTTVGDLLRKCGLQVGYAETLTLANFVHKEKSVAYILSRLKADYGLSVFFDLQGKVYAGRMGKVTGDTVKYVLRRNVISDDSLQFHSKDDLKIEVRAICFKKDGTKVEATKGDKNGVTSTLYFYDVSSLAELATLAEGELQKRSYDGYAGEIETFLRPYVGPCMIAQLTDPIYPARGGNYYVEGVEISFGTNGGRRKVSIGIKV